MATKNFTLNASADDAMEISGTVTLNGANGVVSAAARYAGFSGGGCSVIGGTFVGGE